MDEIITLLFQERAKIDAAILALKGELIETPEPIEDKRMGGWTAERRAKQAAAQRQRWAKQKKAEK